MISNSRDYMCVKDIRNNIGKKGGEKTMGGNFSLFVQYPYRAECYLSHLSQSLLYLNYKL